MACQVVRYSACVGQPLRTLGSHPCGALSFRSNNIIDHKIPLKYHYLAMFWHYFAYFYKKRLNNTSKSGRKRVVVRGCGTKLPGWAASVPLRCGKDGGLFAFYSHLSPVFSAMRLEKPQPKQVIYYRFESLQIWGQVF